MIGLAAVGGDAVDVHAAESGRWIRQEIGAGLLDHLTASSLPDLHILGLNVAAWEQPPVQAAVMDQEQAFAVGSQHQAGASDVAGVELNPGERLRRTIEQEQGRRMSTWLFNAWPSDGAWKDRATDLMFTRLTIKSKSPIIRSGF